jgi:N-methylhydantoinase A
MQLNAERSGREISSVYKELEAQASHDAKRMSPGAAPQWSRYAQMRYAGQGFEIHVDLPPGPVDDGYGQKAIDAFKQAYLRRHKFLDPEGSVEAVDWTLVATIPSDGNGAAALGRQSSSERPRREKRSAWFPEAGGYTDTTIVNRAALADGAATTGPAIIEDPDCTAVVLPGDVARISDKGHILIEINSEALQ